MIQFVGMLLLLATTGLTFIAAMLWLRTRRATWGKLALGIPASYLLLLVGVTAVRGQETLPPGTPLRFCGFYLDCHLSVTVTAVERGRSAWIAHLQVMNDARRVALAPHGLKVELIRGDTTVTLVPDADDLGRPIPAGERRAFTVAFAAAGNGEAPTLRVREGFGVDRVIEGVLLGDDDALGRARVRLGL